MIPAGTVHDAKVHGDKSFKVLGVYVVRTGNRWPSQRHNPNHLASGRLVRARSGAWRTGKPAPPVCCCGNVSGTMRGTVRKISMPRRLVADLMHASIRVPLFRCGEPSRSINCWKPARWPRIRPAGRRSSSRRSAWWRKTSPCCARSTPNGRGRISMSCRAASPWWRSRGSKTARIAFCRRRSRGRRVDADRGRCADPARQGRADRPGAGFSKDLADDGLPLPFRRLFWLVGLNFGRQRANYFGSFGVTSVAAYGGGELHALSPGPFILSYGVVAPTRPSTS